jgi:hypothetical protein
MPEQRAARIHTQVSSAIRGWQHQIAETALYETVKYRVNIAQVATHRLQLCQQQLHERRHSSAHRHAHVRQRVRERADLLHLALTLAHNAAGERGVCQGLLLWGAAAAQHLYKLLGFGKHLGAAEQPKISEPAACFCVWTAKCTAYKSPSAYT